MSTSAQPPSSARLLGAHIARFAASHPQRQALVSGRRSWTYGELERAVRVSAAELAAHHVGCGDVVLMAGVARPEALITLFASARLGAVVVPVPPSSTAHEIEAIAAVMRPVATIGDAEFLASTGAGQVRLSWDAGVPGAPVLRPDADVGPLEGWRAAPGEPAIVAFTSGTSGRPKGVVLTHDNLYWATRSALETLELGADDKVLIATPIGHAAVFAGLPQHVWAAGGCVVLASRFEPDLFLELVAEHSVTTAFVVAVMISRLLRSPRWATTSHASLRWLLMGGGPPVEALTVALGQSGITAINSYGLTETSGGVTYARPDEVTDHPLSAGPPVPHVELRISGADGRARPRGVPGEIWLRGPTVAREYIVADGTRVPVVDENGWLRTGDRGLHDPEGRLFVTGRLKDTIITGGENLDPAEVEQALSSMPGIADVAVLGLPDPVWGEVVAAVVVPEPGAGIGLDDLRAHLQPRLARHKIPRLLIIADALPRTPTGKVQRGVLLRKTVAAARDAGDPGRT